MNRFFSVLFFLVLILSFNFAISSPKLEMSPAKATHLFEPSKEITGAFKIRNLSGVQTEIELFVSGNIDSNNNDVKEDLAEYIELNTTNASLAPGERIWIGYSFNAPAYLQEGLHRAKIVVLPGKNENELGASYALVFQVFVENNFFQEPLEEPKLPDIKAEQEEVFEQENPGILVFTVLLIVLACFLVFFAFKKNFYV